MALPTAVFDPTKVLNPAYSFVNFIPNDPDGDPGTPVAIKIKKVRYNQTGETVERTVPDADGYLRPDYQDQISRGQEFIIETDQVKSLQVYGGTDISGGFTVGTVEIWVVGRRDATGFCSVKSNKFKATWQVDGGFDLEAGTIATASVKVTSLEKVTLTPDAAV